MSLKDHYWKLTTRLWILKDKQYPAWRKYAKILFSSKRVPRNNTETINNTLLLLAWEFPPQVSGGVYRPSSFTRYAAEAGWKTTVITGPAPDSPTRAGQYILDTIPESASVHNISSADVGPHPWPLPRIDGGILNAVAVYEYAINILNPTEPCVILASGPPFHNFVAGMWLAKRLACPLVLDYRDEWTESPHGFNKSDATNKRMEERCLRHATRVIFTTKSQLEHQIKVFRTLEPTKCVVVHNGWEPNDFFSGNCEPHDSRNNSDEKLEMAFFGNLGPWWHPNLFLNTLAKVYDTTPDLRDCMNINFVGRQSSAAMREFNRFRYKDAITLTEQVPKAQACRMMMATDALLLLNPPSLARYIPGKLYEYIASGTPILLYGAGGEMGSIINDLKAGLEVPANDTIALEKALRSITSCRDTVSSKRSAWLQSRTRETLASKMLSIFDDLMVSDNEIG